jgi:hypothetical protein
MSYITLPKRVFNSPLIEFANFSDGSHINLIRLSKPYANGISYAVYETTKNPFCSNGLFKTYEKAKEKFELMIRNQYPVTVLERGVIDHSKPYPNTTIL